MPVRRSLALASCALAGAVACAGPDGPAPKARAAQGAAGVASAAAPAPAVAVAERAAVVRAAKSMLGVRYRHGGRSAAGFDCSGLVVYSYARAGLAGLPRSAADLERAASPVRLADLRPGDLLFFRIDGRKTSHVAIYVGDRSFVHAPSRGGRVERVAFDDVYWGPRLARAGTLLD
jgi:cell wall-associated NlpC family hydrolase